MPSCDRLAARAALLPALVLLACAGAARALEAPRRIVLISIDTLRPDRLGCYGSTRGLTPSLDRLAAQSVVFERELTQATWTLPSHASLLTSRYPSSHGAGGTAGGGGNPDWRSIRPGLSSLAQALKDAGYRTEGLYSAGVIKPLFGFSRGFDSYAYHGPGRGDERRQAAVDEAAAILRKAGKERLFLFLHTNLVHDYVNVKVDAATAPPRCPLPEADYYPDFGEMPAPQKPGDAACERSSRAYDESAACMDSELAPVLEQLSGPAGRDALVVVTSDHGELLCEPHPRAALRGHGFAGYEELVHVPLLVRFPGSRHAGLRVRQPVREIDVAATILAAAGVAPPAGFEGRSLLPLVDGGALAETPVFSEGDDWASVSEGGRAYIRHADGLEELYDLAADPRESDNLAAKDARLLERYRRLLAGFTSRPGPGRPPRVSIDAATREALRREGYLGR